MTTTALGAETTQPLLLAPEEPSKGQLNFFNGQIMLNPFISKINFFCFLLYTAFMGLILLPLGLLQASVLGVIYKLSSDDQAYVTSTVQFAQLALQLIVSPWIGYFCDKYGRKIPVCCGLTGLCLTIFLTPNLPSPYPYYILNQCVQGMSFSMMILPPILADYIDKRTHGRMAGFASVLVNTGSFFMTSLNAAEDTEENLRKKFLYLGIVASGLALVIVSGLKGGAYHKVAAQRASPVQECISVNEDNENTQTEAQKQPEAQPGLMAGIKEAKNPWIFAGYVLNFLMMSSVGLTNFSLVTYIIYLTQDKTKANLAYLLVSKFLLSAAICSVFFGFFADKFNKFKLIVFTVLCSITSITLLLLIKSPTELMAYISMIFYGAASAGFITFSTQLLNKYASAQFRGSVVAFGGMISLLASASINILGVYLIHFNVLIPFFMYFGFALTGLLILVILYISKRDILNQT